MECGLDPRLLDVKRRASCRFCLFLLFSRPLIEAGVTRVAVGGGVSGDSVPQVRLTGSRATYARQLTNRLGCSWPIVIAYFKIFQNYS